MPGRQPSTAIPNNHRMDSSQKLTQCVRISPYRTSDNLVELVLYLIHRFSALSRYIQLGKLAL